MNLNKMERECNDSEREKVEALGIFPLESLFLQGKVWISFHFVPNILDQGLQDRKKRN